MEFSWGEWGYFPLQELEVGLMDMDVYWAKMLSSWGEKGHRESPQGPKLLRIAPIMTVEETGAQRSPDSGTHELPKH